MENDSGYSQVLKNKVEKICKHYEENDSFDFLQQIIRFMADCIEHYIAEKKFVLSKKYIHSYITEAMEIWENDGSAEKLHELSVLYHNVLKEAMPYEKILKHKILNASNNCVEWILYNGHDDPQNQFVYDFLEIYIDNLTTLKMEEKHINFLLEKYFEGVITDNDGQNASV